MQASVGRFAGPAAAARQPVRKPFAGQVPVVHKPITAETREIKAAFMGGLFGGGGAAIDDSKPYICVDCGYIYDGRMAFSEQPNSYKCPVCSSAKKRFKPYKGDAGKRPRNDNKSVVARLKAREW